MSKPRRKATHCEILCLHPHHHKEMLLLCDAGICCSQLLHQARQRGAQVLGRLDSVTWKQPWARLHDGSYVVKVSHESKHHRGHALTVRVIEYQLKDRTIGQLSQPIRLVTTAA